MGAFFRQNCNKTTLARLLSRPLVATAIILFTGLLAYSNTFHVPFFLDDNRVIVDNFLIKDLANLWPPTGTRWLGSLTFALNYAVGGLQVSGYHVVNLVIHLTSALLVYRLVVLTFQTPLFVTQSPAVDHKQTSALTALAAAFLFVAHPIQTQAVTYIVQRFASLATLLFLASTDCYILARLAKIKADKGTSSGKKSSLAWYVTALLFAVLAMKTKEIAFTLPVIIIMYEFTFLPGRMLAERLRVLVPLALTLLIIPYALLGATPDGLAITSSDSDITRHDYLLTQFRVIVTYLRLLILPLNQMIDYVFPLSKVFFTPAVFLSFLLLAALLLTSIMLLFAGREGNNSQKMRLVGFGGVWFFITLSIESSIIPITDVIFEHRLYLPTVGVFMAVTAAGSILMERLGRRQPRSSAALCALYVGIMGVLPIATYLRNEVWRSEITLWEDVARKSPDNSRALAIIGVKLIESKKIDLAIERFQEAIRVKPDYVDAIICLGNAYLEKGMLEEGYQQYLKALVLGNMDFESRAQLMMNIGNYNIKKGLYDRAIYYYQNALSITPNVAAFHFNLGQAYKAKGMINEASAEIARAKQLNPDRY